MNRPRRFLTDAEVDTWTVMTVILYAIDGQAVPDYLRRHPVPAPPIQRITATIDGHRVTWARDGDHWCRRHGRRPCTCWEPLAAYATADAVDRWWRTHRRLRLPSMRLARQDPAVPTGRKRSTRWEALTDWLARVRWGRLFVAVAVLLFLYTAVR